MHGRTVTIRCITLISIPEKTNSENWVTDASELMAGMVLDHDFLGLVEVQGVCYRLCPNVDERLAAIMAASRVFGQHLRFQ